MSSTEESLSSEAVDVVGQLLFELDEKREFIAHGYGSLEETPIAQRALAEDRVVETADLAADVPARYANLPGVTKLTCTPVAAAGRWLGVIFADRDGEPFDLTDTERLTMHALGR